MPETNDESHVDLSGLEAIEKIREITKNESCHFGTYTGPYHLITRPMYTQQVDDQGNIWFFSDAGSNKNAQIKKHSEIKLTYYNKGEDAYLSISGDAVVLRDQAKIDELWSAWAKTWFPEGKDDPNLTLLKVTPSIAYYWDSKHGAFVSNLKIAISTVTGARLDDGREGELTV